MLILGMKIEVNRCNGYINNLIVAQKILRKMEN